MTDQVLDILKLVLLALLYLFFARVLWAVWSEVRQPDARGATEGTVGDGSPAVATKWRTNGTPAKPPRGRRGTPARLVVLEPKERRGVAYAIGTAPIKIGRDTSNTIVIADDAYVSSLHATVSAMAGGVVVDDAASKNGTYVNGARVHLQRGLAIGDRIQIGATVLEAQ